ncbi:DUF3300 domain-containing protein [bacterium]|nr:DUF3300 domain-containing protein [bacterium]
MNMLRRSGILALLLLCITVLPVFAAKASLSENELERILAPIALFPDSLLGNILTAATRPDDVVAADAWIAKHEDLPADKIMSACEKETWDPSVKALLLVPEILEQMCNSLTWTLQIGEAFVDQNETVFKVIQKLRKQAKDSGNLTDSKDVKIVSDDSGNISIGTADPNVIIVPRYSPTVVYTNSPSTITSLAIVWGCVFVANVVYDCFVWDWYDHHFWCGPGYNHCYFYGGAFRPWGPYCHVPPPLHHAPPPPYHPNRPPHHPGPPPHYDGHSHQPPHHHNGPPPNHPGDPHHYDGHSQQDPHHYHNNGHQPPNHQPGAPSHYDGHSKQPPSHHDLHRAPDYHERHQGNAVKNSATPSGRPDKPNSTPSTSVPARHGFDGNPYGNIKSKQTNHRHSGHLHSLNNGRENLIPRNTIDSAPNAGQQLLSNGTPSGRSGYSTYASSSANARNSLSQLTSSGRQTSGRASSRNSSSRNSYSYGRSGSSGQTTSFSNSSSPQGRSFSAPRSSGHGRSFGGSSSGPRISGRHGRR